MGEGGADAAEGAVVTARPAGYTGVLVQIALLDIIFSLDSVITAVGMSRHLAVMVAAMVAAVGVMMFAAGPISDGKYSLANVLPGSKVVKIEAAFP